MLRQQIQINSVPGKLIGTRCFDLVGQGCAVARGAAAIVTTRPRASGRGREEQLAQYCNKQAEGEGDPEPGNGAWGGGEATARRKGLGEVKCGKM